MENRKMTIFYKKKNNSIDAVCTGIQTLQFYTSLDIDEAELIYGLIVMDYNPLILQNKKYFEVYDDNGIKNVRMIEEYKSYLNQLL